MNNSINKKLSEIIGKMDEKVLQTKLNSALEMLKNGSAEELAKKINKMDKNELIEKINDFDGEKLKELNINKNELNRKITNGDLEKLSMLIGERGDEVIERLKAIINKP